jgi:hypothetical protein
MNVSSISLTVPSYISHRALLNAIDVSGRNRVCLLDMAGGKLIISCTTAMKVVFSHSVISLASGLNLIDALRSV